MAVAIFLSWLVIGVSLAANARSSNSALVLAVFPFDARARASIAETELARASVNKENAATAASFARAALQRDPTVVAAWRVFSMSTALSGQDEQARRLFQLTERMSRRDLVTQLWLIEDAVRRNDIDGALTHYDVAIRTSTAGQELLFPILIAAIENDELTQPIGDLLLTAPPWRQPFFQALTQQPSYGDNVAAMLEHMSDAGPLPERSWVEKLIRVQIGRNEYDAARRIYSALQDAPEDGGPIVNNGGFERRNEAPPFDWEVGGDAGVNVEQTTLEGRGNDLALVVQSSSGDGRAARQLLLLPPGSYEFRGLAAAQSSTEPPASLRWKLFCAKTERSLLSLSIASPSSNPRIYSGDFEVPGSGCAAQWLQLGVSADLDPAGGSSWVDNIEVVPIH